MLYILCMAKASKVVPLPFIRQFIRVESAAGICLFFAAALAILVVNGGFETQYKALLATPLTVMVGEFGLSKSLLLWVNDGLMAIFFLLVGLEIKREILEGDLKTGNSMALPLVMAAGGMIAPAAIYAYFNFHDPAFLNGWAIPAATDIAFALGVLALFGSRVPIALKLLLTTVAIIDDLGAILVIAFFYTTDLNLPALATAGAGFALLIAFNIKGVKRTSFYVAVGAIMWFAILKSGVHATLAGVLLAMTIPIKENDDGRSMLYDFEDSLHIWVAFLVLPIFGFANSGISFAGLTAEAFTHPVPLGIMLGLVLGKPLGIFGLAVLARIIGLVKLPPDLGWQHLFALSCLCGIGFTMSLFIGGLAFDTPQMMTYVKLGVLSGSILSGIIGSVALTTTGFNHEKT